MAKTKDPNARATNQDLSEAVDAILKGMDNLFKEERKFNVQTFTSKDDLKTEIGWVRDDINGLKADLVDTVSKKEFNQLKGKVDKYLTS
jgi:hypothetical protein